METNPRNTAPFPNIPPILETDDREYHDGGIVSTDTFNPAIPGNPRLLCMAKPENRSGFRLWRYLSKLSIKY